MWAGYTEHVLLPSALQKLYVGIEIRSNVGPSVRRGPPFHRKPSPGIGTDKGDDSGWIHTEGVVVRARRSRQFPTATYPRS